MLFQTFTSLSTYSYDDALAQINPLSLILRIMMVVEWDNIELGDIEPDHMGLDDDSLQLICSPWYQEWSEYKQMISKFRAVTEDVDCSDLKSTAYHYWNRSTVEDISKFATWQPTQDPNVGFVCQGMIPKWMVFEQLKVDPNLFEQWIFQLIVVAVILRVVALVILWTTNNEGFSWIRKQLTLGFCCVCAKRKIGYV